MLCKPKKLSPRLEDNTRSSMLADRLAELHEELLRSAVDSCAAQRMFSSDQPGQEAAKAMAALYRRSYLYMERGSCPFRTTRELAGAILSTVPQELCLLSAGEYALLEDAVAGDGQVIPDSEDDYIAALSLTKRLWIYSGGPADPPVAAESAFRVWEPVLRVMRMVAAQPEFQVIQCRAPMLQEGLQSMLYVNGAIDGLAALATVRDLTGLEGNALTDPVCIHRFLLAAFDVMPAGDGRYLLVCPGAQRPYELSASHDHPLVPNAAEAKCIMMTGMLPDELDSSTAFCNAIGSFLRPGYAPGDVAMDMRLLYKQGATDRNTEHALKDTLLSLPTDRMLQALHSLGQSVVPWRTGRAVIS